MTTRARAAFAPRHVLDYEFDQADGRRVAARRVRIVCTTCPAAWPWARTKIGARRRKARAESALRWGRRA